MTITTRKPESEFSVTELIAKAMVRGAQDIKRDIAPDLRTSIREEMHRNIVFLEGVMTSEQARVALELVKPLPDSLSDGSRHADPELAHRIRTLLGRLTEQSQPDVLGEPMPFGRLETFDVFEHVETEDEKSRFGTFHIPTSGRFMRLEWRSVEAIGLKGSSHPGKIMSFNSTISMVRKVMRPS
ncbi:MAG: hypothetical protein AAB638_01960 [Patescibacteria group bacterium]